jgi:PEGA domain
VSPPRSPFVYAFQTAPAAGSQTITEQEVARHSFADFLSRLMATLSGSMELAEMEVCSEPDAALIVIDSKRMGSTNASFVVSLGHHQVSINGPAKSCNIKANAGQDRIVSCPKNASCKLKRSNGT